MSVSADYSDIYWSAADGVQIAARKWTTAEPRGAVLIVHGIGDHGGRFEHVANYLVAEGYNVIVPDLRGHGRSAGQRAYIKNLATLLDDLDLALQQTQSLAAGQPVMMYGQSFGGLLAIYHTLQRKPAIAGLIASSPALRIAMPQPAWKIALGKSLGVVFPRLSVNAGLDINELSDDPQVAGRLRADRYRHGKITPAVYFGMIDAGQWCLEYPNQMATPLLLMHGDADTITDHLASIQFAERQKKNCELKIWPGARHELHNMTNKCEVLETVVNFQNRCIRATRRNTG